MIILLLKLSNQAMYAMRGRPPDKFELKRKDRVFLRELLHQGETPLRIARRAQILLGRAKRQQRVTLLAEKIGQHASTIWRVCERYRQFGLQAALQDAPRSGHPRAFSPQRTQSD